MSTPTMLDDSLYDEAERLLKKIKEEAVKKKEKSQSKKNRTTSEVASVSFNSV